MAKSAEELKLVEEAAEWIVQLSADDPETQEHARRQFEQWKNQSQQHQKIAMDIERYLVPVQQLNHHQQRLATTALKAGLNSNKHYQYLKATGLVLLLSTILGGGYGYLSLYPMSYLTADLNSKMGDWRTETLADGSQIQLGSATAVNVEFSGEKRIIHLVQGEIHVDVAKDPARPFIVTTEQGSIQALGTVFSVEQHANDYTQLNMLHSSVEATILSPSSLATASNYPQQKIIYAGQRVQLHPQGLMFLENFNRKAEQQKWSQHQLVVENRELIEVLDILNQNYKGKIFYQAQDLEDVQVNAVLSLDQTSDSLNLLKMADRKSVV